MTFALDTNIISYLLRGNADVVKRWRTERLRGNDSVIPLISYYEVKRGLISVNATTKLAEFEKLCMALGIVELSISDANVASQIYAERTKLGRPIEDSDLLIAAQAISQGYTLVTNNMKHFEGIEGLDIVNWVE